MLFRLALASLALALASCGAPTAPPSTPKASLARQPGSWKMLHYAMDFEGTGLSGDMADMVKAGKASVGKKEFGGPLCLSADRAAKDDLNARLQEVIRFGPEWKVVRSNVSADGTVDFAATLEDPAQGRAEMTITGKLTATTTDLLLTTDSHEPAPGKGHIHTVMKQENDRDGDCKPGQDAM